MTWQAAREILAVRMDNIGDIVMLGPALRAIKATSPSARITLLASPAGTSGAPLLPWVDDVITWRAIWQDLGQLPFDPSRELEFVATLRERRFDAALIFTSFSQNPHAPSYACYLAGIPLRAGESKEFGGATLTTELRALTPDAAHQVDRNLALVEALGFRSADRRLEVAIPPAARASARAILARHGIDPLRPYVVVHPGASARARRYPPERFGAVARQLSERGWQVLVPGSERERELLAEVWRSAPEARTLLGETSVVEYAAIVDEAALVVCNDSLPMHLADALSTPVVVLYAGTDLESQWQPRHTPATLLRRDTPCYPCYRFDCPISLPCLDFAPAEVVAAAEALLERAGSSTLAEVAR